MHPQYWGGGFPIDLEYYVPVDLRNLNGKGRVPRSPTDKKYPADLTDPGSSADWTNLSDLARSQVSIFLIFPISLIPFVSICSQGWYNRSSSAIAMYVLSRSKTSSRSNQISRVSRWFSHSCFQIPGWSRVFLISQISHSLQPFQSWVGWALTQLNCIIIIL